MHMQHVTIGVHSGSAEVGCTASPTRTVACLQLPVCSCLSAEGHVPLWREIRATASSDMPRSYS